MAIMITNLTIIAIVINGSTGLLITMITMVTTITGVHIFTKFLFGHYLQVHKTLL
jgi:hypothetical protein